MNNRNIFENEKAEKDIAGVFASSLVDYKTLTARLEVQS